MAENNKSYRIRTVPGAESDSFLEVKLDQDYESIEILSLKLSDKDTYKLHNSDYGVVVGRVLANGNFGVPNAKISVFFPADESNSSLEMWNLYPYTSTSTKNNDGIRYNLLPDKSVKDCHKAVGTFPNKTFLLENDALLEVFDDYYVYTTRTNAAGDYLLCGVPTGTQMLHMDLDLSDCGILSQRPRDFVYKGYTIEQFENPNQFKKDENIDGLSQIFSQNQPVYVRPFWGNKDNGDEIGITRADINISFKFEPTCVFMGSAISDNVSNGVGKKCVPTNQMGAMDELTAGEGTIEMIRKTPGGNVEEFSIKGNQVIDGNGVWCYQIPMNLDYMMTDEYGNMVPTDDPEKGIPTRARVRFRASLTDMESSTQTYFRAKYLIPNNPNITDKKVDYNFGTYTEEDSFRDLFWNGVYTVKSYIPRFQKSKRWKSERFSGIKACNYYGGNNPMPYNNMRIKLPFMFTVLCIFVKLFIKIVALVNRIIAGVIRIFIGIMDVVSSPLRFIGNALKAVGAKKWGKKLISQADRIVNGTINRFLRRYAVHCTYIGDGLCPDMEGWYFAPACAAGIKGRNSGITQVLMENTLAAAQGSGDGLGDADQDSKDAMNSTEYIDETSLDYQNMTEGEVDTICLTTNVDYLVNCFEMNLAEEYRVIKFDFYNDWVNGVLYFPRWMRKVKRKKKYRFNFKKGSLPSVTTYYKDKVKGCMNSENSTVKKTRYYTQQCSLAYQSAGATPWTAITTDISCHRKAKTNKGKKKIQIFPAKCHKKPGMQQSPVFGKKSGLVTEETTMLGQFVYYLKPCEWKNTNNGNVRTLLFATDIVFLGTLNDCDENGIPQAFKFLSNSSYIMPTNLALTTMDDDAYIYAAGDGTVCSSSPAGRKLSGETSVNRITPDYGTTYSAYTQTEFDKIQYEENDDPVPVTEAAGITWNYSGPGQDDVEAGLKENPSGLLGRLFGGGNKRYSFLYYPGGHFLGLSCTNSESNIKSCVNLKRICELGATMSQRREEVRGYNEASGTPVYRYYVPTGLISNVDIESATFRSMFATLNHNKLIATDRNEVTGYKKYHLRYLRPDGFDGSLGNYVHMVGSPYNKRVNDGSREGQENIKDSTNLFMSLFKSLWSSPDDYDPHETKYTERRTVETAINDYYMFRFGLDSFSTKEQKRRFLKNSGGKVSMPQYENSFYFYFGLKDGSTALDEFKKQFFSVCDSNNVAKEPSLMVQEHISPDLTQLWATIIVNNMLPPLTVTRVDNTTGAKDIFQREDEEWLDMSMEFGHEYTITVTDSIDQTVSKTFVFGDAAFDIDASVVNYRCPGTGATTDPKKGGFIKVADEVRILREMLSKSNLDIDFRIRKSRTASTDTEGEWQLPTSVVRYVDEAGEVWWECHVPSAGRYDLGVKRGEVTVSLYTALIEDNTDVNLYVACDYLAYKGGINPELNTLSESNWDNGTPFRNANADSWLMRHSFYRQTQDDTAAYDCYVYSKGDNEVAVFGYPENAVSAISGSVNPSTYYKGDFTRFDGYNLDESYNFIPTVYGTIDRRYYEAMSYSDDGRAAADASELTVVSYSYDPVASIVTLTATGFDSNIVSGRGCVVVLENGVKIFPVVTGSGNNSVILKAYTDYDIYPNGVSPDTLARATVYRTMITPVIYKPFYGELSAVTWNDQYLSLSSNEAGDTVTERNYLPLSYIAEGRVHNGLTFNNHFYSGDSSGVYDTYFVFPSSDMLYTALTASTASDYTSGRTLSYSVSRTSTTVNDDDVDTIIYAVKEGIPDSFSPTPNALTERYEGGVDQNVLTDSCSIINSFYSDLRVKCLDADMGRRGDCRLYSEEEISDTVTPELRKTSRSFFTTIRGSEYLTIKEDGDTYLYGYYNENSKYDKKGAATTVIEKNPLLSGVKYKYSITNEKGERKKKKTGMDEMISNGVSAAKRFVPTGITISSVINAFNGGTPVTVGTPGNLHDTDKIGPGDNTIIARYERPADGSRNSMVVYKLYHIDALPLMFPSNIDGEDLYMTAPTSFLFSKYAVNTFINVTSNVKFKIELLTPGCTWLRVDSSTSTTHDTTDLNVKLELDENTNTPPPDYREARLLLTCVEDIPGDDPDFVRPADVTIVVTQSATEAPPEPEPSGDTSTNTTEGGE